MCLEGVWKKSGSYLKGVRKVSEECMLSIQMVSRQYKYCFWRVKRGCLDGLKNNFQFQLEDGSSQDSSSQDRSSWDRSSQNRSTWDKSSPDKSIRASSSQER